MCYHHVSSEKFYCTLSEKENGKRQIMYSSFGLCGPPESVLRTPRSPHFLRTTGSEDTIVTEDKFYAFRDHTVCLQNARKRSLRIG